MLVSEIQMCGVSQIVSAREMYERAQIDESSRKPGSNLQ